MTIEPVENNVRWVAIYSAVVDTMEHCTYEKSVSMLRKLIRSCNPLYFVSLEEKCSAPDDKDERNVKGSKRNVPDKHATDETGGYTQERFGGRTDVTRSL